MNNKELAKIFSKLEQEDFVAIETTTPIASKKEISRYKNEIRLKGRLHFESSPLGSHPRTGEQIFKLEITLLR